MELSIHVLEFGETGNVKLVKRSLGTEVPPGHMRLYNLYVPVKLFCSFGHEVNVRKLLGATTHFAEAASKYGFRHAQWIEHAVYNDYLQFFPMETYKRVLVAMQPQDEGRTLAYFQEVQEVTPKLLFNLSCLALALAAAQQSMASELPQDGSFLAATEYQDDAAGMYSAACTAFGELDARPFVDMAVEALCVITDEDSQRQLLAWVELISAKDLKLSILFSGATLNTRSLLVPMLLTVMPKIKELVVKAQQLGQYVPVCMYLEDMHGIMAPKLRHALREMHTLFEALYRLSSSTLVPRVARNMREHRTGLRPLFEVMNGVRSVLNVLTPNNSLLLPHFSQLLGDLHETGAEAVAANPGALASLEGPLCCFSSNLVRVQGTLDGLPADIEGLRAGQQERVKLLDIVGQLQQKAKTLLSKAEAVLAQPQASSGAAMDKLNRDLLALQTTVTFMSIQLQAPRMARTSVEGAEASSAGVAAPFGGDSAHAASLTCAADPAPSNPTVMKLVERLEQLALGIPAAQLAYGGLPRSSTLKPAPGPSMPAAPPPATCAPPVAAAAALAADGASPLAALPLSPLCTGNVPRGGAVDKSASNCGCIPTADGLRGPSNEAAKAATKMAAAPPEATAAAASGKTRRTDPMPAASAATGPRTRSLARKVAADKQDAAAERWAAPRNR